MKRTVTGLLLFMAGCSTAPWADFLDHFKPARIDPSASARPTRGGVCDPPPGPGAGPAPGATVAADPAGLVPRLAVPANEPPPPEPPAYRPGVLP
jgi:hypothetical protein